MTNEMDSVVGRLQRLRGRVRRLLALDATARLVSVGLGGFALMAALDWWVRFPAAVRAVFLVVGIGWAAWWSYRRIWKLVRAEIPLAELALRLRTVDPAERDRLAGVVSFLSGHVAGSPELWRRVIDASAHSCHAAGLDTNTSPRRAWRAAAATMLLGAAAACFCWWEPGLAKTGLQRLTQPLAAVEWPRRRQILPLSGDVLIARGDSCSLAMKLVRGDSEDLRAFVSWHGVGTPIEQAMMRRDKDGVYRYVIDHVRGDLSCFFTAGDDDTAARPIRIRAVDRPVVAAARVLVRPPDYARVAPPVAHPADGSLPVVRGSKLHWEIDAGRSMPSASSAGLASYLSCRGREKLPLNAVEGGRRLSADLVAEESGAYQVVLVDENGIESRGGPVLNLEVRPDEPPTATFRSPPPVAEMTANGIVRILALARDDVGLASVELMARKQDSREFRWAELLGAKHPLSLPRQLEIDHAVELRPLGLMPGDLLEYWLVAGDEYRDGGPAHTSVRSAIQRLRIVSESQITDRLARDLVTAASRLRRMLSGLEAAAEEAHRQERELRREAFSSGQAAVLENLSEELVRMARDAREIEGQVCELRTRAETNRVEGSEVGREISGVADRLEDFLERTIRTAGQSLRNAIDTSSPEDRDRQLALAREATERGAETLREVFQRFDRWNTFDEALRRLHDALDRQESLFRLTARAGGAQNPSAGDLARLAREQAILQSDASQLLQMMIALGESLRASDAAVARAMEKAARTGMDRKLLRLMSQAAQSIARGQPRIAVPRQEQAAAALRAMSLELSERRARELEQLSRRARDARSRLARIILAQEDLLKRNQDALRGKNPAAALAMIAERQDSLLVVCRNLATSPELGDTAAGRVKDHLNAAGDRMAAAMKPLESGDGSGAEEEMSAALEELRSAMELLTGIQRKSDEDLARRSLAALLEALVDVRQAQASLRNETAQVEERARATTRPVRSDRMRLSRLAAAQDELASRLESLRTRMPNAVVFDYVCAQAAEGMKDASKRLSNQQLVEALAHQDDVLRALNRLVDAAQEAASQTPSRFADTGEGGAGADQPTPEKPIPALAELRVLRLLQADVAERTAALHQALPESLRRKEEQLQAVERLGRSQAEIHDLAEQMVEKARASGGGG